MDGIGMRRSSPCLLFIYYSLISACMYMCASLAHTEYVFCRYMVQYLTTPDTAQKIFLGLPRRREALGVSKSHGLNISSEPGKFNSSPRDISEIYATK